MANSSKKLFLSPEEYLLLTIARIELDDETVSKLKDILGQNKQNKINWQQIIPLSRRLGVQPLLYKHLSESQYASLVPDEILHQLGEAFRQQSMRSLRQQSLISQILAAMNDAHIPVVFLKGASLAKQIYKDIALRPMNDIDMLCKKQDKDRIREKMNELGYDEQKITGQSPLHEDMITRELSDRFPPFVNSKGNKTDIHFQLFPGTMGEEITARIWENLVLSSLNGIPMYSLSPEDQVLHLSLHLHKHFSPYFGVTTLYWFCDIHEVITRYQNIINWQQVCVNANAIESCQKMKEVLCLLKKNWRTPVPDDVLLYLDKNSSGTTHREKPDLAAILRKKEDHRYHYAQIFKAAWEISGWRNRLSFFLRFIFPTQEYLISRYHLQNPSYVWLYYIFHPCALMMKAGKRLLGIVRRVD